MPSNDNECRLVVAVKARPLSAQETLLGCKNCIHASSLDAKVHIAENSFKYDHVYTGHSQDHENVVRDCIVPLLEGVFNGYNATVFAYGQTGSGKTHTMGGANTTRADVQGVIPWVVAALFSRIDNMKDTNCTIRLSFVEIYKEKLKDLLYSGMERTRPAVNIREDANCTTMLSGATEIEVHSHEETKQALAQGILCRTTGSTNMNKHSSRSHAVFTITLEQRKHPGALAAFLCAKMHLVDLAGSEHSKCSQTDGERLEEGRHINRGLLALGNVISALVDGRFVPYRDSKLTWLLKDSLGGNSCTVMLACVSPGDADMKETLSTLRYADRARRIKNKPVVNCDPTAATMERLCQQVEQLRTENKILREASEPVAGSQVQLDGLQERIDALMADRTSLCNDLGVEMQAHKQATDSLEQLQMERDELHKLLNLSRPPSAQPADWTHQQWQVMECGGAGLPPSETSEFMQPQVKDAFQAMLEREQATRLEAAHLRQELEAAHRRLVQKDELLQGFEGARCRMEDTLKDVQSELEDLHKERVSIIEADMYLHDPKAVGTALLTRADVAWAQEAKVEAIANIQSVTDSMHKWEHDHASNIARLQAEVKQLWKENAKLARAADRYQKLAIVLQEKLNGQQDKEKPTKKGLHAIDTACVEKDRSATEKPKDGPMPLHEAVYFGKLDTLKSLLRQNVDVNQQDERGWTALHLAAKKDHVVEAKLLLHYDARVDIVDNQRGWTPLHCAAAKGQTAVAQLLLRWKSDANTKDKLGRTSALLAEHKGFEDLVRLLKRARLPPVELSDVRVRGGPGLPSSTSSRPNESSSNRTDPPSCQTQRSGSSKTYSPSSIKLHTSSSGRKHVPFTSSSSRRTALSTGSSRTSGEVEEPS